MFKRLFKLVLWPVKKIVLFPLKFLLYSLLIFIAIVLFFQYRKDYGVDVSPLSVNEYENCINVIEDYEVTISLLSEYVDKLDSEQKSFLERNLPNPLNVLTTPQEISNDDLIHLTEIKLPDGVELLHGGDKDHDTAVVKCYKPVEEKIEEPVEEEASAEGDEDSKDAKAKETDAADDKTDSKERMVSRPSKR